MPKNLLVDAALALTVVIATTLKKDIPKTGRMWRRWKGMRKTSVFR